MTFTVLLLIFYTILFTLDMIALVFGIRHHRWLPFILITLIMFGSAALFFYFLLVVL